MIYRVERPYWCTHGNHTRSLICTGFRDLRGRLSQFPWFLLKEVACQFYVRGSLGHRIRPWGSCRFWKLNHWLGFPSRLGSHTYDQWAWIERFYYWYHARFTSSPGPGVSVSGMLWALKFRVWAGETSQAHCKGISQDLTFPNFMYSKKSHAQVISQEWKYQIRGAFENHELCRIGMARSMSSSQYDKNAASDWIVSFSTH